MANDIRKASRDVGRIRKESKETLGESRGFGLMGKKFGGGIKVFKLE